MEEILAGLDTSVLSACLSTVCGDLHLMPGWHFKHCNKVETVSVPHGFGTWVPSNSHRLLLFKMDFGTLVWIESTDTVYHTTAPYCLRCPVGVALVGHFVLDTGGLPRLLVYDAVCGQGLPEAPADRY